MTDAPMPTNTSGGVCVSTEDRPARRGKLIDATAERRCYGLTEAQVDQFVTAECGRRDVHNGHQGVGGTHA